MSTYTNIFNGINLYQIEFQTYFITRVVINLLKSVGQPAWQESSKVKSQSRDFRFIFDEKWRSTLRLKYVGLQ